MNVLGFVFSLLTLLTFNAVVMFEKQASARRLCSSYLGHIAANRQILNQATSEFYASFKHTAVTSEKKEKQDSTLSLADREPPPVPLINPSCARLNLFPLIEPDLKEETLLYESAAKMLRIFYGKALFEKKRAEYTFLDAFLQGVREQVRKKQFVILEQVSFKNPHFQSMYYKMLKGTKNHDLSQGIGFPSLLDYIKVEASDSKTCLFHAHPNLLSIFFTTKGAEKIYRSIHALKAPPMTKEGIERICQEVHAPLLNTEVFDFFEMTRKRHGQNLKMTLIGEDPTTHISLRKVVEVPKPSDSQSQ